MRFPNATPFMAATCVFLVLFAAHPRRVHSENTPKGLPPSILREVKRPDRLPGKEYTLVRTWQVEDAGHNVGKLVDDNDAVGSKAWEARLGMETEGALVFGPYIKIDPGDYVAFFRIKLLEAVTEDAVAQIDACVAYGQEILAWSELHTSDLTVGKYVQVPLAFRYRGGKLECRVMWMGDVGLRVDTVSLFKMKGADLAETPGRAPIVGIHASNVLAS